MQVTPEYRSLRLQVRLLSLYALLLTALGIWLALRESVHVKSLTAETVDIVEPDGTIKLALFNKEHLPPAVVNGVKLPRSGGGESGLMFYNEEGTECGGLTYSGKAAQTGMSLTFDKYNQDQELQLDREQDTLDGQPVSSNLVNIFDRPTESIDKTFLRLDSIQKHVPDRNAQHQAIQALVDAGVFGRNRLQLGRKYSKEVGLFLHDDQRRPRMDVFLDKDNQPHIRCYDEQGKLTAEWPKL